jgi:hypothetical protein
LNGADPVHGNQMKLSKLIVLLGIASSMSGFCPANAQGMVGPPVIPKEHPPTAPADFNGDLELLPYQKEYQKEIKRRLCAALMPYPKLSSTPALVSISIHNGFVSADSILFIHGTGSIESDFACFDAVMSSAPFHSPPLTGNWNRDDYSFYGDYVIRSGQISRNTIINNNSRIVSSYFKSHPKQVGKVLLTRSIPQSVRSNYLGMFTQAELDSQHNIKALKISMFDMTLEKQPGIFTQLIRNKKLVDRYKDWENFERDQPMATKTQILHFEKTIDTKYAELFEQ